MKNKTKDIKLTELQEAIAKSKKSFLFVGMFSMFVNILMLVPALYMLQLYDRVMASRSEETLYMLTGIVVILFITMALLEIVRSKVLIKVSNKLDTILSERIFNSIFDLANKQPGKATAMTLSDLATVKQFMTGNGLFAFFDAPWIPIYIAVLFMFHSTFGYFAIFAAIVLMTFAVINEYSTKEKLQEANILNRSSSLFVESNLRNAEVINAMGMKSSISEKWKEKHYGYLNAQNEASNKAGVWANISKTTRMMFQSLILGIGGYLAIHMEVSSGMMIAGSIIMGRALAPLDLIINSWKGFNGARSSYKRIDELLEAFPKEKEYMQLPAPQGNLSLENVIVFPPLAEKPSLYGVNMKINKGEVVGIIGPSAAGKSSLARVMLGLWPLKSGNVRIDGADIYQWDREDLGAYIGYLPQDIELFEGTVSQNIARFGEVDPAKVVEAAQIAGVHELILSLVEGYDTVIGAGGATLSGGQRQRIAFARAIYNDPVFVVLDEPNSNLDEQGEKALVTAVNTLKAKGTTVVLITHRPNILQTTDKLAVINAGVIELYGDTKDVLAKLAAKANESSAALARPAK